MNIKKKAYALALVGVLSLGVVGCSNNDGQPAGNEEVATDATFIKAFEKAINKRWDEQVKLEKKFAKDTSYTEEKFVEDTIKILEDEIEGLEKNQSGISDKELKKISEDYIEGVRKQIEANKTQDFELQSKYIEESDKLRKPTLIAMVDEYEVAIKEEHMQTYKDFKEQALVINKEVESQAFADKLAMEMAFEKTTNEYGDVEYTLIVENTSDFDFENISYDVQYKDADGVVIGNDFIYLEKFYKGAKQKVTLRPYEEGIESLVVTTDWIDVK